MTDDSPNPFQSPQAIEDRFEPDVAIPWYLAIQRAAGLGLLGAGAFFIPVFVTLLWVEPDSLQNLELFAHFSAALGWVFATSEILRIAPVQGKYETAYRVAWSGGIFGGAFLGVLWFHDYLFPGIFPTGPPDARQPGFWIIATAALASHVAVLLGGRQVLKSLARTKRDAELREANDGE